MSEFDVIEEKTETETETGFPLSFHLNLTIYRKKEIIPLLSSPFLCAQKVFE